MSRRSSVLKNSSQKKLKKKTQKLCFDSVKLVIMCSNRLCALPVQNFIKLYGNYGEIDSVETET